MANNYGANLIQGESIVVDIFSNTICKQVAGMMVFVYEDSYAPMCALSLMDTKRPGNRASARRRQGDKRGQSVCFLS